MRVKMLESKAASLDGASIVKLEKGEVYEVRDELAERLVDKGSARPASEKAQPTQPASAESENQETETEPEAAPPAEEPAAADEAKVEPEAEADPLAELLELKRPELDKLAKKLKIADADKLPNKQAVAEAIVAARA